MVKRRVCSSPSQGETPEGILIATGSEVDLAVKAQKNWLKRQRCFCCFYAKL